MKKINLISIFVSVALLITVNHSANAGVLDKKDCTNYKTLSHEWNACKLGSKKYPPAGSSSSSADASSLKEKKKGKAGSAKEGLLGVWKKIKNAGGKNIGEPG